MSCATRHGPWLALLVAVAAAAGCRSRGNVVAEEVAKEKDKKPGAAGATGTGEGGEEEADPTGPKVMGYEFFSRQSYSIISGKYSDEQDNETVGRTSKLEDVKVKGARYTLEHYPLVYENFPHSEYGYSLLELRSESPQADYWTKRQTVIALMGYIFSKRRLIAPVVGIHWEWNKIDQGLDDSPEVAKSDIRATVVGVNFRQKIWGTGTWFGSYYAGRIHLLNPSLPSNGIEAELGVGTALQWGIFRTDLTLGYLEQRYSGKRRASKDEDGMLKLKSRYQATYAMVTLWI